MVEIQKIIPITKVKRELLDIIKAKHMNPMKSPRTITVKKLFV